ncbi:alpha-L-fucosidase [Flavihumibacter sp. CACIAM 22H1]|uniref:alpha-L-fucosidase n=1 Tax=Flavihumibacter sp. CACIAM 22H1 TaxID=1812911 RepID=UPI0007A8BCAC|nr:alpha-L-fucosidase [Flavihumibacter sp. CACIAM 22H1]KYP14264.1 MAG: alpha-L-fucosidase [Flavihumibacter sp. CACIAM 22H1]
MPRSFFFCFALLLSICTRAQSFEPNWESLNKRGIPAWFNQEKFGIFIHWGVFAVPSYAPVIPNSGDSYAEWYWYRIHNKQKNFWDFHVKNYGASFAYQQFEPLFKAELFNPDQWAELFKNAGARYVVLTSKHHEGYTLWPSAEADKAWGRPWNAVSGTPQRDLLGDLTNAVRTKGLKMGYYYSLYEWYNPIWLYDKKKYVEEHMFPQFKDLVTRYKPSVIFSDGEWDLTDTAWKSPELMAWLFNESPVAKEVVINDRWGKHNREKNTGSTYTTSEYGSGMDASVVWEENQGIGHSYGYNRNENLTDYKSSDELILMLIDIVSRGGNLLLNVGPTADGRIPVIQQQRLLDMGAWLKQNGEAIYGTTALKSPYQWSPGKMPEKKGASYMAGYSIAKMTEPKKEDAYVEAFFTQKGRDLYIILPRYVTHFTLRDKTIAAGATASCLANGLPVQLKKSGKNLVFDLSTFRPDQLPAKHIVLKVKNAGAL